MRPRPTNRLVLSTLAALWLGAVIHSLHYRDFPWLQVLFVDIAWVQALVLSVGALGAFMVLVGALTPRRRRALPPPAGPFVSVIVPAKNEEAVIEATVRSLCGIDYQDAGVPRYEIIVVDDGSTDRTGEILKSLSVALPVKMVRTPPGSIGKAAALNLGTTRARGDLIAVCDADARVAPDFLLRMVASLAGSGADGVQSQRRLYNAGQNLLTRIQDDEYRLFYHPLQRARQVLGGMVSFSGNGLLLRRDALQEVGGWNEDALTEDIDLSVRFHLAGYQIRYCEEAVVWEEAVPRLRDLMRQRIRWFEGAMRCLGDHLPAMLFGRVTPFKRVDMVIFLSGGLLVTLSLLTTYVFGMIDVAGAVVLYVQLPRRVTTWTSGLLTAGVLLAMLVELRGRLWAVVSVLVRSGLFSLHRLIVVPLAIHRYLRSAITGHTVWEKTAHGATLPPHEHDL
ncbi:MAG: glycosyltransferase family 2 protein [Bacillati bacterium ANGP1]|uniref:Beta-monoglucosyldiacylglycerol synthase n=1 Tax=Candidatus Segetimicrobium genomatis TaxID=2569760 RepID=A0A537IKA8_9BACT|nr:MAG: glycosyltransferase family 2 protein [Terrabacteria group bacterium ANGP1]